MRVRRTRPPELGERSVAPVIAVTACYPIETRGWVPPDEVRLVRTAIGERAADALDGLAQRESVSLLVSTGFCGGLRPELRSGDLVLADVIRHRGEEILVASDLLRRARGALDAHAARSGTRPVQVGACETAGDIVDGAAKRTLAEGGGLSVDMESGPLARWSRRWEIPFLVLRVVLDPLDADLPFTPDRSVASTFVRHPIRSARTARSAARAGRRLGRALADLVAELKEAP